MIKSFDGGEFDYYLALPASGYGPGIVVLQEVFGVNDAIVAQRAAALRTQAPDNEHAAKAFTREARKVMTPHQLEALFRRYQARGGGAP